MKYHLALITAAFLLFGCSSKEKDEKKEDVKAVTTPKYILAAIEKTGVAEKIKLPAQMAAYEEVSIFPKVNAYVKTVLVDIGSKVSKGSLLMELEAPELTQAVMQARERYVRTRSDFTLAKEQYQRLYEASQTDGAVSPIDLSTARSRSDADSALCNAEKANWQMQQTMLDYLKVIAPFDGVITERNVHPGALVSAVAKDKPMLELKQVKHLRLQVDIPEGVAAHVKNKDTVSFTTNAFPGKKMTGFITRKSMNITSQFRSERMEIDIQNPNETLSPGMFAEVLFDLSAAADALSVPRTAVVTSTERKYVLVMRNNKIVKVDVSTGKESSARIEIYGLLQPGEQVIVNANDEIKETN